MSLLNLKSRDAEIFECLEDTSKKLGYEAIEDLKKFVNEKYLPQTKYASMLTLHELLVRALDELWGKNKTAHLKVIKDIIQIESSDQRFLTERNVASSVRGLGFESARDKKGYFVEYNPALLDSWKSRYPTEPQENIQSSEEQKVDNSPWPKSTDIMPSLGLGSISQDMLEKDGAISSNNDETKFEKQLREENVDGVEDVLNKDIGPKEKKDK